MEVSITDADGDVSICLSNWSPLSSHWAADSNFHCGLINLRAPHRLLIGLPSISCSTSWRLTTLCMTYMPPDKTRCAPLIIILNIPPLTQSIISHFITYTPPPFKWKSMNSSLRRNMKTSIALFPSQWAAGRFPARFAPDPFDGVHNSESVRGKCVSSSGGRNLLLIMCYWLRRAMNRSTTAAKSICVSPCVGTTCFLLFAYINVVTCFPEL